MWLSHRSRDTNKALNCIARSRDTNKAHQKITRSRDTPFGAPPYHRNNEVYVCSTTTRVKDTISARSYPLAPPPPYHRNNEVYVCNTTTRVKDTISARSYPLAPHPTIGIMKCMFAIRRHELRIRFPRDRILWHDTMNGVICITRAA